MMPRSGDQLDLFPDTLMTPERAIEERILTYMSIYKAERRPATLQYLRRAITERLALENT
jgi:hypothetical protein